MTEDVLGSQDADDVRSAYDAAAEDYAAWLPDTRAEQALDLAMVDAFVAAVGGGRVLDAGCGAGRMTRYLASAGVDVEGCDLSPGMVAQARAAQPDVRFEVASIADLPYADGSFDGALVWYSTIHTPDAELAAVLSELVRVVRPGGHLLVAFQAGAGTKDLSGAYRSYGHDLRLERYRRSADRVADLLARAGTTELARLVRAPVPPEDDEQAMLLVRRQA